jgi:hypothetical protein
MQLEYVALLFSILECISNQVITESPIALNNGIPFHLKR